MATQLRTGAQVASGPEADSRLTRAVRDRLHRYDPLRTTGFPVEITSHDGVVELTGNVRSRATKAVAGQIASQVPGVREVKNNLFTDTDLEIKIATALALDDRTELSTNDLSVKSILGIVYLTGTVAAEELDAAEKNKALAVEIAQEVDGVRRVIDKLEAVEAVPGEVVETEAEEAEPEETPEGDLTEEEKRKQERQRIWRERMRQQQKERAAGE